MVPDQHERAEYQNRKKHLLETDVAPKLTLLLSVK